MKTLFRLFLIFFVLGAVVIIAEFINNIPSHSFNAFRYYTLYGGGERCLKDLEEYTNDFVPLGTFERGHCKVKNAVRISSYKNTKLSEDLTLSCPTAVEVGEYFDEIKDDLPWRDTLQVSIGSNTFFDWLVNEAYK